MLHIYPVNDEMEHDTENGTACWCNPEVQLQDPLTGEMYSEMLIIHNAADCRELIEQAEKIKNKS